MKKVFKYQLGSLMALQDFVEISMPKNARFLHCAIQGGHICIWALVDPEQETETFKFRIAGTGHPIEDSTGLTYLNTIFYSSLVFHIFYYGAITRVEATIYDQRF